MLGRARTVAKLGDPILPIRRHARRDRKTVLGVFDRGRQHPVERPRAAGFEQRVPRLDRARHVDGINRLRKHATLWGDDF